VASLLYWEYTGFGTVSLQVRRFFVLHEELAEVIADEWDEEQNDNGEYA